LDDFEGIPEELLHLCLLLCDQLHVPFAVLAELLALGLHPVQRILETLHGYLAGRTSYVVIVGDGVEHVYVLEYEVLLKIVDLEALDLLRTDDQALVLAAFGTLLVQ